MATENLSIAASADDAYIDEDDSDYDDSAAICRIDSNVAIGVRKRAGFRFVASGGGIQQGDALSSASLVMKFLVNDDANCDVDCEAHDDAPTFSALNTPLDRTPIGSNPVAWVEDGTADPSALDITAPVQDVVDRPGWGTAIVVLGIPRQDVTKSLWPYAYDNGSNEAELHLTYTPGGASIPIVAHHHRQQQGVN